jgi:hypothetical protein
MRRVPWSGAAVALAAAALILTGSARLVAQPAPASEPAPEPAAAPAAAQAPALEAPPIAAEPAAVDFSWTDEAPDRFVRDKTSEAPPPTPPPVRQRARPVPLASAVHNSESQAAVALGTAHQRVQRSAASQPLALSTSYAFTGGISDLPSFDLEVAPYWFAAHPDLDVSGHADAGLAQLVQNLTASLGATSRTQSSGRGALGAVALNTFVSGREANCAQLQGYWTDYQADVAAAKLAALERPAAERPADFQSVEAQILAQWRADPVRRAALEAATRACTRPRYWSADLGSALVLAFPDADATQTQLSAVEGRAAFGLLGDTASLTTQLGFGSRAIETQNNQNAVDVGLLLSLAVQSFRFSLEGVYRRVTRQGARSVAPNLVRTGLLVEAALIPQLWLLASITRDFGDGDIAPIVSRLGLRFELGERRLRANPTLVAEDL